ncbi:MAG: VTT domain-containing protein [bacterium]|nr:VTT domain-containing protein [bacterium]MDZ4296425.1 VTT domain-containing protein [Patescibacteria group bacterium]
MDAANPPAPIEKRELIQGLVWLVLIFVVISAAARFIGFDGIKEKVAAAGAFGPLIVIIAKASTLVFAPLGGSPIYPIAGALFGFTKGFILTLVGDILGATISFYISRWFGRGIVQYLLSKPGLKIAERMLVLLGTPRGLMRARLMLFALPEAVSYGAGLTNISFLSFIGIDIMVRVVSNSVLVAFGDILVQSSRSLFWLASAISVTLAAAGAWWFYRESRVSR